MHRGVLKFKAIELRKQGKSYREICAILSVIIPKSTLSTWFKGISLTVKEKERNRINNLTHLKNIRPIAHGVLRRKRVEYLTDLLVDNIHLRNLIDEKNVAKVALVMLYLGEGSKTGSYISFCNSNPKIIALFMRLLCICYDINTSKLRATVQCRADQNIKHLEKFWYNITNIPRHQFYKTQIDPRTVGKTTKKLDYKGVCKIDYFSAYIYDDLMQAANVMFTGP